MPNFLSERRFLVIHDDPLRCWHCEAFIDHEKVDFERVHDNRYQHLAGKRVEMKAAGLIYRGIFVEMTDEDVKLRGETGWIILDVTRVTRIEEAGREPSFPDPVKQVAPDFYEPQFDPEES